MTVIVVCAEPDHIRIVGGSNYGAGRCATAAAPATTPAPSVDRWQGGREGGSFFTTH